MTKTESNKPKRPVSKESHSLQEAKRIPITTVAEPKTPQPTKKTNKK